MRRPAGESMAALVERDQLATIQPCRDAVPVVGVGAEAVQKQHGSGVGLHLVIPLQVMEVDPAPLEPAVAGSGHGAKTSPRRLAGTLPQAPQPPVRLVACVA